MDISVNKLVWELYADRVKDFVPEILEAISDDHHARPVDDLCALAIEDFDENEWPYYDMMCFAISEVKSRGYTAYPAHGTRLPGFPDFPEEFQDRASKILEAFNVDSYDITEVLRDVVVHYLGWCKSIILFHWLPEEARDFADKLDETEKRKTPCVPLIIPQDGGVHTIVCVY